jgi:hypothetical protein
MDRLIAALNDASLRSDDPIPQPKVLVHYQAPSIMFSSYQRSSEPAAEATQCGCVAGLQGLIPFNAAFCNQPHIIEFVDLFFSNALTFLLLRFPSLFIKVLPPQLPYTHN